MRRKQIPRTAVISLVAIPSLAFSLVNKLTRHVDQTQFLRKDLKSDTLKVKPVGTDTMDSTVTSDQLILLMDSTMQLALVPTPVLQRTNALVARKKFEKEYDAPAADHYSDFRSDLLWPKETVSADSIQLSSEDYAWEFHWPVEVNDQWRQGKLSSRYGRRWGRRHNGIDLKLCTGDTLHSMFSGKVRFAGWAGGYGRVVIIRHHNGLESLYGHMSKVQVKPGDMVKPGDVIGKGGNTGRSTGPHLHLEMRYKGHPIDPQGFIDVNRHALRSDHFDIAKSRYRLTPIAS